MNTTSVDIVELKNGCDFDTKKSKGEVQSLEETKNLLSEAEINVSEAIGNLSRYGESIDYDNQKSREIEERINTIISLSRKHRVDPDELIDTKIQIEKELNELNNSQTLIDETQKNLNTLRKEYDDLSIKLTKKRGDSAKKLSGLVADSMNELGMTGGIFEVEITPSNNISQHGNDDITFHISANPGQKPQPLSNIASGGELSRMSLAIQVITSNGTNIPTMIFDEVDSGIGGAIAEVVGNKLKDLGQNKQVLCVTHLAQVASKGSSHIRINKLTDNKKTKIYASKLNSDERIEEIARMIGGILPDDIRDMDIIGKGAPLFATEGNDYGRAGGGTEVEGEKTSSNISSEKNVSARFDMELGKGYINGKEVPMDVSFL